MLEAIKAAGGRVRRARVTAIEGAEPFDIRLDEAGQITTLRADRIVNAAGRSSTTSRRWSARSFP